MLTPSQRLGFDIRVLECVFARATSLYGHSVLEIYRKAKGERDAGLTSESLIHRLQVLQYGLHRPVGSRRPDT